MYFDYLTGPLDVHRPDVATHPFIVGDGNRSLHKDIAQKTQNGELRTPLHLDKDTSLEGAHNTHNTSHGHAHNQSSGASRKHTPGTASSRDSKKAADTGGITSAANARDVSPQARNNSGNNAGAAVLLTPHAHRIHRFNPQDHLAPEAAHDVNTPKHRPASTLSLHESLLKSGHKLASDAAQRSPQLLHRSIVPVNTDASYFSILAAKIFDGPADPQADMRYQTDTVMLKRLRQYLQQHAAMDRPPRRTDDCVDLTAALNIALHLLVPENRPQASKDILNMQQIWDWSISILTQCVMHLDVQVMHELDLLMASVRILSSTMSINGQQDTTDLFQAAQKYAVVAMEQLCPTFGMAAPTLRFWVFF